MSFNDEVVDIVDKQDNVIGTIFRKDEREGEHILRSASVFLVNEKDEILLQLRSQSSKKYPLHWDLSGGGHVNSNEKYEDCARRELFEEIGIKVENITLLGKHHFTLDNGRKRINCSYISKINEKCTSINSNEVDKIKWFSIKKIRMMINNKNKFHPECEFLLKKYFLNVSISDNK